MVGMTQSDSQGLEAAVASNGLHKPGLSARNHQPGEAHAALLSLLNYELLVDSGEGRHCLSIDELTMP